MGMFGFKKHCPICGMDVNESSIKRFGKHFCSNTCVEKYLEKKAKEDATPRRSGSC